MARSRKASTITSMSFFAFQDIMTSVVGIFILIILIMVLELVNTTPKTGSISTEVISRELLNSQAILEEEIERLQAEFDALQKSQASSASVNAIHKEQTLRDLQNQLQDTNNRIKRVGESIDALSKALIEAKTQHELALADSESAESERQELDRLTSRQEEINKIATILETEHPVVYRDKTIEGRFLVLVRVERGTIMVADAGDNSRESFTGPVRIRQLKNWLSSKALGNRQILLVVKPTGAPDYEGVALVLEELGANYGFDVSSEDANFTLRSQLEVRP